MLLLLDLLLLVLPLKVPMSTEVRLNLHFFISSWIVVLVLVDHLFSLVIIEIYLLFLLLLLLVVFMEWILVPMSSCFGLLLCLIYQIVLVILIMVSTVGRALTEDSKALAILRIVASSATDAASSGSSRVGLLSAPPIVGADWSA